MCLRLAEIINEQEENQIFVGHKVIKIRSLSKNLVIETNQQVFECKRMINCSGLHSDRLTQMGGQKPPAKIVPFKGEYFELNEEVKHLCKNLIYPVPDPEFPFLGVHFTRMIDGTVECGPNAVLAFGREAYGKFELNIGDLLESITYSGFQKWRSNTGRWAGVKCGDLTIRVRLSKPYKNSSPEIKGEHIKSAPAGIRAQAVSPSGALVDDFLIRKISGSLMSAMLPPLPPRRLSPLVSPSSKKFLRFFYKGLHQSITYFFF